MTVFFEELIDGRYVAWILWDDQFSTPAGRYENLIGAECDCRNSLTIFERAGEVAAEAGIDTVRIVRRRRPPAA